MSRKKTIEDRIKTNYNKCQSNDDTHYCSAGESHLDGCECQCDFCVRRQKELELKEFNEKLNKRIAEGYEKW